MADRHLPPSGESGADKRYYTAGKYILPSDELERERLLLQHKMLQDLSSQPLIPLAIRFHEGDRILDVGTGSGVWAIEVSALVPRDVQITGCDIESRLFPSDAPKNTVFVVCSAVSMPSEWSSNFVLVHQALLMFALSLSEWKRALSECFRVLQPGGWIHLREMDVLGVSKVNMPASSPITARFRQALRQICVSHDLWPDCVSGLPGLLTLCGFEDVEVATTYVALGPGDIGEEARKSAMGAFRGMKMPMMQGGGFGVARTEEEYEQFMEDMEAELATNDFGANLLEFTARKPEGRDSRV